MDEDFFLRRSLPFYSRGFARSGGQLPDRNETGGSRHHQRAGQNVGTATFSAAPEGVKIVFDIKNLPPGKHPVHIHQSGKCEPPDFKSAGSHFEGAGHSHTMPAGDIPNFVLTVNDDGKAHVTTVAPYVTLGHDDNSLFSGGGTAIIIHATSTEVNSGTPPLIACGVISMPT